MAERKPVIITPEQMEEQRRFMDKVRAMPQRPGSYYVVTYGCQMNAHDSELLAGMLRDMGMEEAVDREHADFVIFNTCCVRDNAERRALGNVTWLKEVRKHNPHLIIAVCGCMIQQPGMAEKIMKQYRFIDLAFGTSNLYKLPELLCRKLNETRPVVVVEDEDTIAEELPVKRLRKDAAYITIMYGCDNFCSYCIVPYVRGRERSRMPEDIKKEVLELIEKGFKDITLLGQNVNSYGKDLGLEVDFSDLLKMLSELPGDFVLRFMTSHPKDASRKLFDTMASSEKIAKHIHLPFQAGNDRVLKEMNRNYTAGQYLELIRYAREKMPEIVLTSDVIVGFPGETDEEFEDTLKLVETVQYDALFTFIYSPREGTPAAKMPDPFTRQQKQARFDRLLQLQNSISEKKHSAYVGRTFRVLIDGANGEYLTARTDGGRLVRLPGNQELIGTFQNVTITGNTTWSLVGEIEEA